MSGGAYHSLFLRKDGVVWAWGQNVSGQLGTGSTSSTPQEPPPLPEPVKRFLASEEDSQPSSRASWLKWLAVSVAGSLIASAARWWS
ncbi:RCC1 domain-containing protein [Corallococcus caeni]|uniref:RCC1 domain-containing protein n=1 Tax=Corallococcus caeni TaxID=3082388 RepID=UPI0030C68F77